MAELSKANAEELKKTLDTINARWDANGDGKVMAHEYATVALDMLDKKDPLFASASDVDKETLRQQANTILNGADRDITAGLKSILETEKRNIDAASNASLGELSPSSGAGQRTGAEVAR